MDVSPALPNCRQMGRSAVRLGGSSGSCAPARGGAPCPYKAPPSLADVLRLPKPPTRQAPALHGALGIGETWNVGIELKKASCQPHQGSLHEAARPGLLRSRYCRGLGTGGDLSRVCSRIRPCCFRTFGGGGTKRGARERLGCEGAGPLSPVALAGLRFGLLRQQRCSAASHPVYQDGQGAGWGEGAGIHECRR